jgi:hypothetical protein
LYHRPKKTSRVFLSPGRRGKKWGISNMFGLIYLTLLFDVGKKYFILSLTFDFRLQF